jgi:hypothetical protein
MAFAFVLMSSVAIEAEQAGNARFAPFSVSQAPGPTQTRSRLAAYGLKAMERLLETDFWDDPGKGRDGSSARRAPTRFGGASELRKVDGEPACS